MSVEVDGDEVYRDALFDVKCKQKIGVFKKKLASEYKGTVVEFIYANGDVSDVLAKDIPDEMTLQQLYDAHGKQEMGTFYVEIVSKKAMKHVNLEIMKKIKELEKQRSALYAQASKLTMEIMTLEEQMKAEGAAKKGNGKTRKNGRLFY
jgi:hypothetical protein